VLHLNAMLKLHATATHCQRGGGRVTLMLRFNQRIA
jgi:hypothetical protein